jgi:hypothetical protein
MTFLNATAQNIMGMELSDCLLNAVAMLNGNGNLRKNIL